MEIKILNGQSLLDIAVQHAGAPEAAFDLALKNGLSITGELTAGNMIEAVETANGNVAKYYAARNILPATDITGPAEEEGIEFWYTEYDFGVS
jgi:2',3'-cyclic-nucleotide 2'-phosphodiesterase (5'-nucleotidase family)